jgi:hypothetical protein
VRSRRGNGALAALGSSKIGENGMKAILGVGVPGRKTLKCFAIAIDRGDAMARSQERIRHRKTNAARCSGEKNDAALRRRHDCLRPKSFSL